MGRPKDTAGVKLIRAMSRLGVLVGTAETAALPAVHAATSPDAASGRFYGPSGFQHLRGGPAEQDLYATLRSPQDGARITSMSAQLAGVDLPR